MVSGADAAAGEAEADGNVGVAFIGLEAIDHAIGKVVFLDGADGQKSAVCEAGAGAGDAGGGGLDVVSKEVFDEGDDGFPFV
jgi:hypothetical protein